MPIPFLSWRTCNKPYFQTALLLSGQRSHARQAKRAKHEARRLKTRLGLVTRGISRRISVDESRGEAFVDLLAKTRRLLEQARDSKNKLYNIHCATGTAYRMLLWITTIGVMVARAVRQSIFAAATGREVSSAGSHES